MKWAKVLILFCWVAVGVSSAQNAARPPLGDSSTNALAVQIWPRLDREVFPAPATVRISAFVTRHAPARAGDFVTVEFLAGTNRLGSAKAVWHDVIRPHAEPGRALPLWVMPAGFSPAEFVWKEAPAGDYTLTARATDTNGLAVVSAPMKIAVRP